MRSPNTPRDFHTYPRIGKIEVPFGIQARLVFYGLFLGFLIGRVW